MDTLKDLLKDRGLYQIYGHHPVYGSNVLLYIGQTYGRTFRERIEEHNIGGGSQEDRAHIEIRCLRRTSDVTRSTGRRSFCFTSMVRHSIHNT